MSHGALQKQMQREERGGHSCLPLDKASARDLCDLSPRERQYTLYGKRWGVGKRVNKSSSPDVLPATLYSIICEGVW